MLKRTKHSVSGFTLIELLVGLLISSAVVLVTASLSTTLLTGQKTKFGQQKMLTNAALNKNVIEQKIMSIGRGFYQNGKPICASIHLNAGATTIYSNANVFYPLMFAQQPYVGTDKRLGTKSFTMAYFESTDISAYPIATDLDGSFVSANVKGFVDLKVGDYIIIAQKAAPSTCAIREVTAVSSNADGTTHIVFDSSGYNNAGVIPTFTGYKAGDLVYPAKNLVIEEITPTTTTTYQSKTMVSLISRDLLKMSPGAAVLDSNLLTNVASFDYKILTKSSSVWLSSSAITNAISPYDVQALRLGAHLVQANKKEEPSKCYTLPAKILDDISISWLSTIPDLNCYKMSEFDLSVPLENNRLIN